MDLRNTRYQADATPYLGRTFTGWIAPALIWRTHSITSAVRVGTWVLKAPAARTFTYFGLRLLLRAASGLPFVKNENFGTFSFGGQLSDKRSNLPCVCNLQRLRTMRQPLTQQLRSRFYALAAWICCACSRPVVAQAV
jgi:hypothetical protein